MDITFITMHDLTADAKLLYASDSIVDVLGYCPTEVIGKSAFEFFQPNQVQMAMRVHNRGVELDKAAMLSYCTLKRIDGNFVGCECVFTVVYSVIVACVSLYRETAKSKERRALAPEIRHQFASSDRDPRYKMLTHLSTKFATPQPPGSHEPRSAIILNRFTRTLTIMYATNALANILGITPGEAVGRSFYEFVQENCLQDSVDALERAKANDSIAYLRFRWRDPRQHRRGIRSRQRSRNPAYESNHPGPQEVPVDGRYTIGDEYDAMNISDEEEGHGDEEGGTDSQSNRSLTPQSSAFDEPENYVCVEVEAVVSCTSDGLVVILRRARPSIDPTSQIASRGVFASPWASTPLVPQLVTGVLGSMGGPSTADFMSRIKDVAVFAWSLRSINENMIQYATPNGVQPDAIEEVGVFDQHQKIFIPDDHDSLNDSRGNEASA